MTTATLQLIQPFAFAGVFIALFIAEHVFPQRRDLMDRRHDLVNIGIGLINGAAVGVAGYFFQRYMTWVNSQNFGLMNWIQLPAALRLLIEFLLLDGFIYWWHRANHQVGFLWRFHAFHHADLKMNSTTALRFHTIELLLSFGARMLFFPLAGISIAGFLAYSIIFTAVVLFQHSSIRLPLKVDIWLRKLIVTPHMHRIHHSIVFEETDSNFSSLFSFWDSLFGTYRKRPQGPIEFGIPAAHQNASPTVK